MTLNPIHSTLPKLEEIDAQASVLMKRGIGLLATAEPNSALEALTCFDSALELRRLLPFATVPRFAYGLAAVWLNRAEALMRLPDGEHAASATHAYDQAIQFLRGLPLREDPRFPRRLAIAYQNRGLTLQAQDASDIRGISAAFSDAIAVLDHQQSARISERRYLLATVHTNLANVYASAADATSVVLAQDAARRAIYLMAELERDDADAAEVGLKARHIFCQAMVQALSDAAATGEDALNDVHEATDACDEGLDLARHWEKKGVARFRSIAADLFDFGARVYANFQPQFLAEFIHDNLDADRSSSEYVRSTEMRRTAEQALRK